MKKSAKTITTKNVRSRSKGYHQRSQRGEGLIAAIGGLLVFLLIAFPVGIFFLDANALLITQARVSHIASRAATVVDAYRFWLDQPRPGFDEAIAAEQAEKATRAMCRQLNITPTSVRVILDPAGTPPGQRITQVDLTIDSTNAIPFRQELFD
jgi:hypothetical protein